MKPIDKSDLQVHVLVCTNEKAPGKACCQRVGGHEFFVKLKSSLKAAGIYSNHRVTRTGCLDYCNDKGCTVAIYRKGAPPEWMTEVTDAEFGEVWKKITSVPQPNL